LPTNDQLLDHLLHDESFFRWVHRTDPEAVDRWEAWLAQHPEHRTTVADAARMVRGIPFAPRHLSENAVHQAWLELQTRLPQSKGRQHTLAKRPMGRRNWLRVAVAAALVGLVGTLAWWNARLGEKPVVYATAYGETRTVVLPDGSEVMLNANSRVRYQAPTGRRPRREVWLEGEAFFKIVPLEQPTSVPFVVYTPDLRVQVRGTQFNVNTRRGRTQVVLNEGSVALQLPSDEVTALRPGELAEFAAPEARLHKATVDTERFTAWRDRRLTFDDTPLSEVALTLEENYGVRVVFDDPALRAKRVTGEISAQKIDTILKALSTLFSIAVERSGNTVRIYHPS
jgi:ferric-dicitrate binding protein FerR (iron transport regulator)